ncbi:enolase C-terminal domain-like protein [Pontibacter akesuensis]|uniref:Enolase C-terminal domain-like n=1 Tax=Pontibacter akesuensis TaxID=388950 RepID=A0A1I7H7J4_9BACT|nr:enolase C-terminal domain-like protein [Pontibacter akesuensis]GHA52915.1 L-Ala-D/L-Glu epimerase [Pontibacter akesuensis]SFU56642.1 Enolase C-terminal domain-like [Pontibacter akesuensis]
MLIWRIEALDLKLQYSRSAAQAAGNGKINFLVQVSDGTYSGFGEAALALRYGETPELLLKQYKVLLLAGLPQLQSMDELLQLLVQHPPVNALRFAIESAYLHYFCQHKAIPVYQLLGQSLPQAQATGFTLPALEPWQVREFVQHHDLDRFQHLKVRVSPEAGMPLVHELLQVTDLPLVLDGHESWQNPDALLVFLESLDRRRVLFVEQPMPAAKVAAYAHLKNETPIPLIAEESLTDEADFDMLRTQFHGISIRLMKAGGYLNTVRLLQQAKNNGLLTVLNSVVETSLSTWSALQLSNAFDFVDLSGFLALEQDPFGLVKEREGFLYL